MCAFEARNTSTVGEFLDILYMKDIDVGLSTQSRLGQTPCDYSLGVDDFDILSLLHHHNSCFGQNVKDFYTIDPVKVSLDEGRWKSLHLFLNLPDADQHIDTLRSYTRPVNNPKYKIPGWIITSLIRNGSGAVAKACLSTGSIDIGVIDILDGSIWTAGEESGDREIEAMVLVQSEIPHNIGETWLPIMRRMLEQGGTTHDFQRLLKRSQAACRRLVAEAEYHGSAALVSLISDHYMVCHD